MKISIVIPAFNEENNLEVVFQDLKEVLESYIYECIFVDDGSSDNTFNRIKTLASKHKEVLGISFSRNFGHQTALLAGLQEASGDIVITMDGDGQHPPQLIPELIETYEKGFEIVNTKRLSTEDTGILKNSSSKAFYKIMNRLTDIHIEPASSDFRLMSRKAVEAFLKIEEKDRFTRGLVSWMGFKQTAVSYTAPARISGSSKYTYRKMLTLAWDGITSFSSKPLRFSLYAGLFSLIFGAVYSIYILIIFAMGNTIPGWASMMLVILLLGGIQLLSLGIIGAYLSRIFNEAKNRPHYFIKDRC